MAKRGSKVLTTPTAIAECLQDIAIYGEKIDKTCPHSVRTWFIAEAVNYAAFKLVFDDLTNTPSIRFPNRAALYDFIMTDDETKRMYFLVLAEYNLSKYTRHDPDT